MTQLLLTFEKKYSLSWTDDHPQEELKLLATEQSTILLEPWR
jgi:hypothetical protein